MPTGEEPLIDDEGGRLIRPYTLTGGRTQAGHRLNLLSQVKATNRAALRLDPVHDEVLEVCTGGPLSVAEVAAQLGQPVQVAKVLLSDLIEVRAVTAHAPVTSLDPTTSKEILEAVFNGLQQL